MEASRSSSASTFLLASLRLLVVSVIITQRASSGMTFVSALSLHSSSHKVLRLSHAPLRSTRRTFKRSTITMMPEGPEVRTLVDQLRPAVGMRLVDIQFLSGRYVRHGRPKGFESFAQTMTPWVGKKFETENNSGGNGGGENLQKASDMYDEDGSENDDRIDVIKDFACKGKFIYLTLDEGAKANHSESDNDYQRSIWITLGMTGRFSNEEEMNKALKKPLASNSDRQKVGPRWFMEMMDNETRQKRKLYYLDSRNFGTLRFCLSAKELNDKLETLGPDLLDLDNTTEEIFLCAMEKSKSDTNICKFLMDQKKIAGVGNYILAEGLYRSRIDPFADLSEINVNQRRSLFNELRDVAISSYNSQGLSRPNGGTYRDVDGNRGKFEFQLQCYGQALSPNNNPVIKEVDGPHGRTIWYVAEEQLFMSRSERDQNGNVSKINPSKPRLTEKDIGAKNKGDSTESNSFRDDLGNHLTDASWKSALSSHMSTESFKYLVDRIESDERYGATIYPPVGDVFSALNLCPLENIKCVIVGQDPYHQPGQGHGLAFSVRKGVTPPPSLRNIFKEAMEDVEIDPPKHGNLEYWASQGVLLLNTVLTVRKGEANSHAKMGWEEFTDLIINTINEEKESVVFLLWGAPASKKASCVDESKHTVIRTSHPSPLGATKTKSPFLGSRCFSRANEALVASGQDPIDWNVK